MICVCGAIERLPATEAPSVDQFRRSHNKRFVFENLRAYATKRIKCVWIRVGLTERRRSKRFRRVSLILLVLSTCGAIAAEGNSFPVHQIRILSRFVFIVYGFLFP